MKKTITTLVGWDLGTTTTGAAVITFDGGLKKGRFFKGHFFEVLTQVMSSKVDWRNAIHAIETPKAAFLAKGLLDTAIKSGNSKAAMSALTVAYSMGKNAGLAVVLPEYFKMLGVPFYQVTPASRTKMTGKTGEKLTKQYGRLGVLYAKKPTKTTASQILLLASSYNTDLQDARSNEHSRDAMSLILGMTIKDSRVLAGLGAQIK